MCGLLVASVSPFRSSGPASDSEAKPARFSKTCPRMCAHRCLQHTIRSRDPRPAQDLCSAHSISSRLLEWRSKLLDVHNQGKGPWSKVVKNWNTKPQVADGPQSLLDPGVSSAGWLSNGHFLSWHQRVDACAKHHTEQVSRAQLLCQRRWLQSLF